GRRVLGEPGADRRERRREGAAPDDRHGEPRVRRRDPRALRASTRHHAARRCRDPVVPPPQRARRLPAAGGLPRPPRQGRVPGTIRRRLPAQAGRRRELRPLVRDAVRARAHRGHRDPRSCPDRRRAPAGRCVRRRLDPGGGPDAVRGAPRPAVPTRERRLSRPRVHPVRHRVVPVPHAATGRTPRERVVLRLQPREDLPMSDRPNGRRTAILGGGKMGEALLSGLIRSGGRTPDELIVTCRRDERARELAGKYGVTATLDNGEATRWADVLVLMAKPQDMEILVEQIREHVSTSDLVISFAAGIRTSCVEKHLPDDVPVVRVMSNVPVMVDEAMSVIAAGSHAGDEDLSVAEELLGYVGKVLRLKETHLDAVTATSGSGPAYFFLLAEAMIEACILLGLSRDVATELIVQTMLGSAKMLRDTGRHPVELREMVTSPGGTTIEAIRRLEEAGVRAAFLNAIDAAKRRSEELARGDDEEERS